MHAKVLKYSVAPDGPPISRIGEHPAWDDPEQIVQDPTWPDIETAIRRLDGYRYRRLLLWPSADEREQDTNPGEHEFTSVIGGSGVYLVRVSYADGREHFLHFPEWPDRVVIVLPDAWGFVDGVFAEAAFRVCRDVEVVLRAVKYYAYHGRLDPSLNWET
jgi:hypothetical protein